MKNQRGMAVIMALLLVALAASAVSLVLWQQNLWWQQVEADRRRAQMQLLLAAQLAWASEHLRQPQGRLNVPWQGREGDFHWQSRLIDMQSRLNLNALAEQGGRVSPQRLAVLRRLLERLRLPVALADQLVRWRALRDPTQREVGQAPVRALADWSQLAQVPGYTPAVLQALAPYVAVLPEEVSQVNLNTATPLLLGALLPDVAPAVLAQAVPVRERLPFRDTADFTSRLGLTTTTLPTGLLGVGSVIYQLQGSVQVAAARRDIVAMLQVEGGRVRRLGRLDPATLPALS